MFIKTIKIKNFKQFKNLDLNLNPKKISLLVKMALVNPLL